MEKSPVRKLTSDITGPSIKSALAGKESDESKLTAMEQHQIFTQKLEDKPFTEEQLIQKWEQYLETLSDRPNLKASLHRKPLYSADGRLVLQIDNQVQEELIRDEKPRLVAWLKRELQNSNVELTTEVVTRPVTKMLYTDGEKMEEMVRKNPALALLKQKFHLDFDS